MVAGLAAKKKRIERGSRIRELVFGSQDGLISTITLVAGMQSATGSSTLVIIGGVLTALGGAISMAAGSYLSTKAEKEMYDKEITSEQERIHEAPYLAQQELLETLTAEGLPKDGAYKVVQIIAAHKALFIETFMEKVLGIGTADIHKPLQAALVMALSYIIGGLIPLMPFLFLPGEAALGIAVVLTGVALFGVGAMKAYIAQKNVLLSGVEFFFVAMGAGLLGYIIGSLVRID